MDLSTTLGFFAAVGLLPWVWAGIAELGGPARAKATRTIRCPLGGDSATVTFAVDHPRDVIACSAFAKSTDIRCTKACRHLDVATRWYLPEAKVASVRP